MVVVASRPAGGAEKRDLRDDRDASERPARAFWVLARFVQVGVDLAAVILAMVVAFVFRAPLVGEAPTATGAHLLLGALSLPVWLLLLWRARLYSDPHTASRLDEFRRIVNVTLSTVGSIAVMGFLLKVYVARGWLVLTAMFVPVTITAGRAVSRRVFARMRARGHLLKPVILVGANLEALSMASMLHGAPALGYRCLGFVDDEAAVGTPLLDGQCVLGAVDDTLQVAKRAGASGAIIVTSAVSPATSNRLTRQLTACGLQVEVSSSLCDIAAGRLFVRPLGRFPVVHVEAIRHDGWQMRAKRLFDVVGTAIIAVATTPVMVLAAAAIKLDSKGPVHFRQKRVGKNGRTFEVLKLRTMVSNAEQLMADLLGQNQADGPLFKLRRDPRITRVGKILRALSIDELPQLWNILRGDMSLVGPRPALPSEVPRWSPELHGRLAVRPGMTGMWQVSGSRRWHSFDEYARLDLYYVDNWSIWTDLAILVKTVPAVLCNRPSKSPPTPEGEICLVP